MRLRHGAIADRLKAGRLVEDTSQGGMVALVCSFAEQVALSRQRPRPPRGQELTFVPEYRILPILDEDNRAFWTGGADGRLHIQQCASCQTFLHPPRGVCRQCLSDDVIDCPVVGEGVIDSFTINHMAWHEGMAPPFAIARVALDHAPGVVITSNIVTPALEEIAVGQRVEVVFERHDDIYVPLFKVVRDGR